MSIINTIGYAISVSTNLIHNNQFTHKIINQIQLSFLIVLLLINVSETATISHIKNRQIMKHIRMHLSQLGTKEIF